MFFRSNFKAFCSIDCKHLFKFVFLFRKMSVNAELKQLVCNTLEENGMLGKIKAQLRSQVVLAINEQDKGAGGAGISRNQAGPVNATPEGHEPLVKLSHVLNLSP